MSEPTPRCTWCNQAPATVGTWCQPCRDARVREDNGGSHPMYRGAAYYELGDDNSDPGHGRIVRDGRGGT